MDLENKKRGYPRLSAFGGMVVDNPGCGELKDQEARSQKTQEFKCSRNYCERKPDTEPKLPSG